MRNQQTPTHNFPPGTFTTAVIAQLRSNSIPSCTPLGQALMEMASTFEVVAVYAGELELAALGFDLLRGVVYLPRGCAKDCPIHGEGPCPYY